MATANEILAAELGLDDIWFEIDLLSRQIIIPKSVTNLGVKSDADVMHVRFKLPRFYYSVDFSQFKIGIDYTNAEGEEDRYEPKDVTVKGDTITFTWIVGRHAALYNGTVTFGLCAKRLNPTDPNDPYNEFHTTKASLPILDGMETCEEAIIMHTDLLEQWREQLFGEKDSLIADIIAASQAQQSAIETKGAETLATIPEDYTTTYNMAEEALRRKANAIELDTEGEIISVNDSSDAYLLGLNAYGRTTQKTTTGAQLAYIPDVESYENNGITWSSNGGIVTAKGNAPIHSYTPSNVHADLKGLVGTFYISGNGKYIKVAVQYTRDGITNYVNAPQEFTLDGTETRVELYCQITTYNTNVDDVAYPMVNVGNAALPWESYTGGKPTPNPEYPQKLISVENPTVSIYGKNLLKPKDSVWEYEGITYTTNIDGSVIVTGATKATEDSTCHIVTKDSPLILPKGTYTLSGCFGGSEKSYRILIYSTDWKYVTECTDGPVSFTLDEETSVFVYIWVYRGNTINETLYPMICTADLDSDYYERYVNPQTLTLNRTLHGIPVTAGGNYTDENGQQWVCDEVDFERGVYVQRVFRETVTFHEEQDVNGVRYRAFLAHNSDPTFNGFVLCDKLVFNPHVNPGSNGIRISTFSTNLAIACYEDDVIDSACVLYPLATPIETPLTAEEIEVYKTIKTNYPNTMVLNDSGAMMKIKYNADTKMYVDNHGVSEDRIAQAIADYMANNQISSGSTASISTVDLIASKWVDRSGNLHSQVVTINGVTENSQVDLTPSVEQLVVFYEKDLTFVTENDGGNVTVYAIGQKPENDYTIQVTITEVNV